MEFDLANPRCFEVNRLPAHSDHEYFADLSELVSGQSGFKFSLSGLWYFSYA